MIIGKKEFDINKTYVMGILNVTPDSFSDGGKFNTPDAALFQCEKMISEGADILDIGGESSRPGYERVSEEEQLSRILPVLEEIRKRFDIPVSVDTTRAKVAECVIDAGCDLINDIWGLQDDPEMASVIAGKNVPCVLMHNRRDTDYRDFFEDLKDDLQRIRDHAIASGIEKDRIILDPGIGFAKNREQNLEAIKRLGELKTLGCPVLLGTSRKSVIGQTLDLPVEERLEGTLATTVFAVIHGCMFVRVHDVGENRRVIRMTEAILYGR